MHTLDLNEPLFIFGDLNMNCLNNQNLNITSFIQNNELINFVNEPTRNCTKFFKKSNQTKSTNTLIDIFLHNGNLFDKVTPIECPFSDHCFLVAKLTIEKQTVNCKTILCRNLSKVNLENITTRIDLIDWKALNNMNSIEEKWCFVKSFGYLAYKKHEKTGIETDKEVFDYYKK